MDNQTIVREVGLAEVIELVKNTDSSARERILEMVNNWSGPFLFYDGDVEHEGTFEADVRPTVIWGSLRVRGAIRDGRDHGHTLLVVLGNLEANDVIARSAFAVAGDVTVKGTFLGAIAEAKRSSWEVVAIGGTTRLSVLINAGHWFHLSGPVEADYIFGHFDDVEHSGYEAAELFLPSYLDVASGVHAALNVPKIIGALNDGYSVIKDNPTTRRRAMFAALDSVDERSTIVLEDAGLSAIPEEVFQAPNLRKLVLDFNEIYSLPPRIAELKELRDLSLDDAPLRSLPEEIGQLANLESLSLRFVKLKRLPQSFSQLKNLRELYLTYSSLEAFPEALKQLPKLEKLSFWHCTDDPAKLEAFIDAIAEIPTLKFLAFGQGEIKAMPENVTKLQHLEELQIVDQKLPEAAVQTVRSALPSVRVRTAN